MSAKIIPFNNLQVFFSNINRHNLKIGLTTGIFDLFHYAHEEFLKHSKSKVDILIVGVESDKRTKILKGKDRPINNQNIRIQHLVNSDFVDFVILLPDNFSDSKIRENFIATIKPDIFTVSEHSPNLDKKRALVNKYKGKLEIVMKKNHKISTTQLINNN